MRKSVRNAFVLAAAGTVAIGGAAAAVAAPSTQPVRQTTATPIRHVVVIFQENVSFDHYFGTYPNAANTDGQPFHAKPGTPSVNGLTQALLTSNPNTAQPQRLGPAQAVTCDQNHGYTAEQKALDGGLMDAFVQNTDVESCSPPLYTAPGLVMDYYDGNTVTGLWNYAQRFAMSDNSFDTEFGPSTPGALNLVSGQTYGGVPLNADGTINTTDTYAIVHQNAQNVGTVINDPDPYYDDCANHAFATVSMSGPNIGDLLSARNITWGWFEGGFAPTSTTSTGTAVCGSKHAAVDGVSTSDYIAHHEPFEYYKSTANVHHVPPAGIAEIGHNGQANHNYDLSWFGKALSSGNLPAVSFLKAAGYQDGHAGYSDPIDEQNFLASTINSIERSRYWHDTAVVISYDDSDGWYDHVMPPIINSSADSHDALSGPGVCGHGTPLAGLQARCGYGQRLPLLVISPYARSNYVDSATTDQTSILAFIEDNWLGGERIGNGSFDALAGTLDNMFSWDHPDFQPLFLNPATGEPAK
jgi:phospholipase C